MPATRRPRFSVDDYLRLPEGFPAELVEGDLVREPSPTRWHQWLVIEIALRLRAVAGSRRVLVAPSDVPLGRWTVLQPDLLVLAPGDGIEPGTETGEPPVLVVEVLSPDTERRDRRRKTGLYLRGGVQEVWLVDPRTGRVEVHTADAVRSFTRDEVAASAALPGFRLSGADLIGSA